VAEVGWTTRALADLAEIKAYIARDNPRAADRVRDKLAAAASSLEHFPDRGRPAGGNERELAVVRPYLIRYEHQGGKVEILAVRHGARFPDDRR